MELRIYNKNLERQGIVENFRSFIWTRKYFGPGDFELHAALTSENLRLLTKDCIVAKPDSLEAGIIESLELTDGIEERELVAKGRFLSSIFDRRLIKQTYSFSGRAEIAMRNLVSQVETIPFLELGELNGFEETVSFQATMTELLYLLKKLSASSGIGFRIVPDFANKTLTFETYKGIERGAHQSSNPRVVFSEEFSNLGETVYSWNEQLLKTKVIVGGEGEGSERVYVTYGGGEGFDLRETFVDARDVRSDDFATDAEYLEALQQRGINALNTAVEAETFDFETGPDQNFKYKENYDLGDIVTVQKKDWNIELDYRITEIQEIYENGGFTVHLTVGDALPDSVEKSQGVSGGSISGETKTEYYDDAALVPKYMSWNSSTSTSNRQAQIWKNGHVVEAQFQFNTNGSVANGASFQPITFTDDMMDLISKTWRYVTATVDSGTYNGKKTTATVDTWTDNSKTLTVYNLLGGSLASGTKIIIDFVWVV